MLPVSVKAAGNDVTAIVYAADLLGSLTALAVTVAVTALLKVTGASYSTAVPV
jgi:hypothetical protein